MLPQKLGKRSPIFFDDYISKGWLLGSPERYSWIVDLSRSFQKIYLHLTELKNLQLQDFV